MFCVSHVRGDTPGPDAVSRPIRTVTTAPTGYEGEGFPVRRAFAGIDMARLDPFIHMDQMGEVEYAPLEPRGTSWHPHRGFETITYMIEGRMRHEDHLGNVGLLESGGVQWMTAARGIIHSEMPEQEEGVMRGFQLWLNLPAKDKLGDAGYRDYAPEEIPRLTTAEGVAVTVIAGRFDDGELQQDGAVQRPHTAPQLFDLHLPAGSWPTVLDCLCARFPQISRDTWLARMARGLVLDEQDRVLHSELVGEIGFFANIPRTANVIAIRDSSVLVLTRAAYAPPSHPPAPA